MRKMKINFIQLPWVLCALLLALPLLGHAEIYKWKDKNGTTKYSDTPPPSNIKQEAIGSKKGAKPSVITPITPVAQKAPAGDDVAKDSPPVPGSADEEAAQKRQNNAEVEKNNKLEKERQDAAKAENCNQSCPSRYP